MKKKQNEACEVFAIHENIVNDVKKVMPKVESLDQLAVLFKTIGDPTRVKILWALAQQELCVCDISYLLQMTQSSISHQLRILKENGLVFNRRKGKIIYYCLKDEHVQELYNIGMNHIQE